MPGGSRLAHGPLEHRPRRVDADHQPVVADGAGEVAREVARAAGDVEHAVTGPKPHQQPRDPLLVGHPGAADALRDPAQGGAPPALVDPR